MDDEFRSVMMNPNDPGAFEPDAVTDEQRIDAMFAGLPALAEELRIERVRMSDPLYVAIEGAITTALIDVWPACEQEWVDSLAANIMEEVIASGKRKGSTIKVKVGEGW